MRICVLVAVSAFLCALPVSAVEVDPALPAYKPKAQVEGELVSVGDDSLNNLMILWAEVLRNTHPALKIGVEGKG